MASKPKILKGYLILKKSSLITHHLKYSNSLKVARLVHCFQLRITQFFVLFVRPIPKHHVSKFCLPTRLTLISFHFLRCLFPLQFFNPITLPKPKMNPAKTPSKLGPMAPISTVTRATWSPPMYNGATSSLFVLSQLVNESDLHFWHLSFEKTISF